MTNTIKRFCFLCLFLLIPFSSYAATIVSSKSYPVYIRNPQQSIHDFMVAAAPQGSTLKNFSHSMMKIQGQEMLVGVYERFTGPADDNTFGREGGFDDAGNLLPIKSTDEGANRQYAFAFIPKQNSPMQFVRAPIISFFDDGGSARNILAIFTANFTAKMEPKLAFLDGWDSSEAGGHNAADATGMQYSVTVVNFQPPSTFTQLDTPLIEKLGGCDCVATDPDNISANETAKARTVKGIKQQLISMGISQQYK